MKLIYIPLLFLAVAFCKPASGQSGDNEILAQRGKGVVTQKTFSARADKIPADIRRGTLRDGNRLNDVIASLLLQAQLAADAREAGFDDQEIVKERMRLAAETELGGAWLQHYVKSHPAADYETLAYEYYQLNRDTMLSQPKIDVSHILISTQQRSDDEAMELAVTVRQELVNDPDSFDDLVLQYSDDPSASANHGKFVGIYKGGMAKPFEVAAFALSDGEISQPVKTRYGYHIILLNKHIPGSPRQFEEVKSQLMKAERDRHEARIQNEYLSGLTSLSTEVTKEALEEMVRRQFGESSVEQKPDGGKPE